MLKITVLGLISVILTSGLLGLKFAAYNLEDDLTVGTIFAIFFTIFDLFKDFIVIFMMLWYVLK